MIFATASARSKIRSLTERRSRARSLTGLEAHALCAPRALATIAGTAAGTIAATSSRADPSTGLALAKGDGPPASFPLLSGALAMASVVGSVMTGEHTPLVFASREGYCLFGAGGARG